MEEQHRQLVALSPRRASEGEREARRRLRTANRKRRERDMKMEREAALAEGRGVRLLNWGTAKPLAQWEGVTVEGMWAEDEDGSFTSSSSSSSSSSS